MTAEQTARTGVGVVLAGVAADGDATIERYAARGYDVLVAAVRRDDVETSLEAVRAALEDLKARAGVRKVAVVGYGPGGRYAFLSVTRLGADAAGAMFGSDIGEHLSESARVKKPLSFHFADDDALVPFAEVRAIKGALEGFGTTEIYRYEHRDEGAAQDAERRVFAVLDSLR